MQTCVSAPRREKKVPDFVQKPRGYTRFCQFPKYICIQPPVSKTPGKRMNYFLIFIFYFDMHSY